MPNSEIVKGYEFEKGRYVIMSEEDLEKVRPESTRVIDLVQFADAASIDPMYVDRTYYLAPDGACRGRRVRGHARRHAGEGRASASSRCTAANTWSPSARSSEAS